MNVRPWLARGRQAASRFVLGLAFAGTALMAQIFLKAEHVEAPFLLVYPAVLFACLAGGATSGAAAVLGGALGLAYFVLPPAKSFAVAAERDGIDLGVFVIVALTLVGLVERRTRSLREAHDARAVAEEAAAAKDAMIAVVAHDLRNPLHTVTLNTELIAASVTLAEPARSALERTRRAAARACRLVETVLECAHRPHEGFPLRKERAALGALVDESLAPFEPLAHARAVKLEGPARATLDGTIVCDEERLVQVLTNVLGNALKFTPRGGTVRLEVTHDAAGVWFTVQDSGFGMTPEELAHAFERFWHGATPGHGAGLGLSIAKTLVEAHGGTIAVESQLGHGTVVRFFIPSTVDEPQGLPTPGLDEAAGRAAPSPN